MSLHFQIDIAFDINDKIPEALIEGLKNLSANHPLTDDQKKLIPNIFKYISSADNENAFQGRSIFYLANHYRYTHHGRDVSKWTLHLRQVFNDDTFYEEGYPLLAWCATLSETTGFIGYVKEELAKNPKLVFIENQEITLLDGTNNIKFKLADFDAEATKWKES